MGWFGSCYRLPSTTQERRAWFAAIDDGYDVGRPVKIRRRRSYRGLPDAWDDWPRAKRGRSWKVHRRTQYKPVAARTKRDSTGYGFSMSVRQANYPLCKWGRCEACRKRARMRRASPEYQEQMRRMMSDLHKMLE
jgi:hypothetical protein